MDGSQSRSAVLTNSAIPKSSNTVPTLLSPPPMTSRLRALVRGVDSSTSQRIWSAQKFRGQDQVLQVQRFSLDDAEEGIISETRVFLSPAERALETQGVHVVGALPAVFLPLTLIMQEAFKFQRKLDMSCQKERPTVFLPPAAFTGSRYELSPSASICLTDFGIADELEHRAWAILLEARRREDPSTGYNVKGLADLLWCRWARTQLKAPGFQESEPLMERIRNALLPPGWSTPAFSRYKWEGNPDLHVLEFRTLMEPNDSKDQLTRIFKKSLKGQALQWYYRLEPNSVDSFETLAQEFVGRYLFNRAQIKQLDSLFDIRIGSTEILKAFVVRFRSEVVEIEGAAQNEEIVCMAFKKALAVEHPLREDLFCRPARSLDDLYELADRRIRVKADVSRLKRVTRVIESNLRNGKRALRDKASAARFEFRASHEEIYEAIKDEPFFRFPDCTEESQQGIDSRCFCRYHNIEGHRIRNYCSFNALLKELASEGRLKEFI